MSPSGDIKKQKKNRQTRPPSSAGSRPPLPKFSGYAEVEAHYIFHPSTIWVRPLFTELGAYGRKQPKSRFCLKQTNICRLSGDIKTRKLYYRKDDRAMRPIGLHGCPENFRESLTTPTATIPNIFHGLLFGSTL